MAGEQIPRENTNVQVSGAELHHYCVACGYNLEAAQRITDDYSRDGYDLTLKVLEWRNRYDRYTDE